jgi:hypothetical protein
MSNPDPVATGIVTAAALQVAKQGQDFIAAAAGRPGESLGAILGGWAHRRITNAETVGSKAHFILLNLNVRPKEPAFNVIFPLLESAALQENTTLQDIWANMLANACDSRKESGLNAVFPYILRDLGHREVKFLDSLYAESTVRLPQIIVFKRISQIMYHQQDLMALFVKLGFAKSSIDIPTFDNQQHPDYHHDQTAFFLLLDLIRRPDVIRETTLPADALAPGFKPGERVYHFTELGAEFVLACRPPLK